MTRFDLVILGAQKAGSTTLRSHLAAHPRIWLPAREFDPTLGEVPPPAPPGAELVGTKCAELLADPEAPRRLRSLAPEARLLVVLRDPIERAVSSYFQYMRVGLLPIQALEVGLRAILEAPAGRRSVGQERVLANGAYGEALGRWLSEYPREQLGVVLFEELVERPAAAIAPVWDLLGVAPEGVAPRRRHEMKGNFSLERIRARRILMPWFLDVDQVRGRVSPRRGPMARGARVVAGGMDRVLRGIWDPPRPGLPPDLRAELVERLRGDVAEVGRLLGWASSPWPSFST